MQVQPPRYTLRPSKRSMTSIRTSYPTSMVSLRVSDCSNRAPNYGLRVYDLLSLLLLHLLSSPSRGHSFFRAPRRNHLSAFIAMKSSPNTACDTLISSFRYPRFYWLFNLIARLPCCSVNESREWTFHVRPRGRRIIGCGSREQLLRL